MAPEIIENIDSKKLRGGYYTPQAITDFICKWAITKATQKVLEPSCGDGNFLSEVLIRKIEQGSTFEQALSTIYGVDLMIDNVDLCRERLLCGREDLRHIVEQNIYQADSTKFSYRFEPMSTTRQLRENKLRRKTEKIKKILEKKKDFERIFNIENSKKKINKPIANAQPILSATV